MKIRIFTLLILFIPAALLAQTTITFSDHSLHKGDSNNYQEIEFAGPGSSGPGQIWDFSHLQLKGKDVCSNLLEAAAPKIDGAGNYNLALFENGYQYLLNSNMQSLEELGYVNSEQKLTLFYSDPVVKMKYPFSYGSQFTDHFVGVALYDGTSKIDFIGDYSVKADGHGTLILPDRTVSGALRVSSVKTGLQANMCGTTDIRIEKYSWYAQGYRYPLLSINIVETRTNGAAPAITKTANLNTQQSYVKSGTIGATLSESKDSKAKSDIKVVISPNPFMDQLTFSYLLTEKLNVSIDVIDMAGKTLGKLVNNQSQSEGLQTGKLDASEYGLTPGVYFLRFAFEEQISIFRIVKL